MIRYATCSGVLAAALVTAGSAQAQDGETRAGATQLWAEAWALKDAGKQKEACEKFFTVQDLYPSASAHVQAGACHEQSGRLASAWSAFKAASSMSEREVDETKRAKLREASAEGIARTEPKLARLRIVLDAPAPPPTGLHITRNGKPLPAGVLSQSLPSDAGEVEIELQAPGFAPLKKRLVIKDATNAELRFELTREPVVPGANGLPTREAGVPLWSWIVGGAGVAAVGVSIGFVIDEQNAVSDLNAYVEDNCGGEAMPDGRQPCNADRPDEDLARRDRSLALAIGFGAAGGAALIASAIGIGLSTDDATSTREDASISAWLVPWATPDGFGLVTGGSFR